ncbi:helix-turn-helix domain-containing protein [Tsuneonella sp. HG094]
MNEITGSLDGQLPLHGVGDRLRMAREKAGMTLAQLAAETRIPQRHLEFMEAGNWNALPARTYATGFARTYAKAVDLDPRETVEDVRAELAASEPGDRGRAATFEPGDPARIPSRGLALASLVAVVILLVGGFMFYTRVIAPGAGPGSLLEEERLASEAAQAQAAPTGAAAAVAAAPQGGDVVFTALEDGVWVKFYDSTGAQLMQKQMAKGEAYTVPADASGPQVWTGRPDALSITIGGKAVPKLAEAETVMRDVPVTASALLARTAPTAASTSAASPAPGATAGT